MSDAVHLSASQPPTSCATGMRRAKRRCRLPQAACSHASSTGARFSDAANPCDPLHMCAPVVGVLRAQLLVGEQQGGVKTAAALGRRYHLAFLRPHRGANLVESVGAAIVKRGPSAPAGVTATF